MTVQALKTANSYGMKAPEYLIYADLRAAGWCKRDAWSVAFQGTGLNWEKAELEREMNKLEALGSVQRRVAEQQEKSRGDEISPEELAKETSKETILKKLVRAEKKAKFGSTDWMRLIRRTIPFTFICRLTTLHVKRIACCSRTISAKGENS